MTHSHDNGEESDPWGCAAASAEKKWFIFCGCDLPEGCKHCEKGKIYPERCPDFYLDEETYIFNTLYKEYENRGTLPYPGSLIEQPKVLFLYFDHFKSAVDKNLSSEKEAQELNAKASDILGRGTRTNGRRR
jgi:hypothetical protein